MPIIDDRGKKIRRRRRKKRVKIVATNIVASCPLNGTLTSTTSLMPINGVPVVYAKAAGHKT